MRAVYAYSYNGNTGELITQRDNKLWKRTTSVLNGRGMPVSSITTVYFYLTNNPTPYASDDSLYNTFQYDPACNLIKLTSQIESGSQTVNTYTWSNGNLVSDSKGYNYTYELDEPARSGDFLQLMQLWPSYTDLDPRLVVMKSKNQLKSVTISGNTLVFNYEKNADGNIIGVNGQISISHNCN